MTRFEKFLQDNNLKKQDVAEYLGKSASSMTYYCKEGNEPSEAMIDLMAQKWDVSAFRSNPVKKVAKEDTIQFYINEVALLRQMVNNQSAIIARYESLIVTLTTENTKIMEMWSRQQEQEFENALGIWRQEK